MTPEMKDLKYKVLFDELKECSSLMKELGVRLGKVADELHLLVGGQTSIEDFKEEEELQQEIFD